MKLMKSEKDKAEVGRAWRWVAVQVRAFHHDRAGPKHDPGSQSTTTRNTHLQIFIVSSHNPRSKKLVLSTCYYLPLPYFAPVCLASQRVRCALVGPLPTMPRKRSLAEMETSEPTQKQEEPSLLQRIRNMWEIASVMQYIFTFGKAVKIDEDFDIEVCYHLLPAPILLLETVAEYI